MAWTQGFDVSAYFGLGPQRVDLPGTSQDGILWAHNGSPYEVQVWTQTLRSMHVPAFTARKIALCGDSFFMWDIIEPLNATNPPSTSIYFEAVNVGATGDEDGALSDPIPLARAMNIGNAGAIQANMANQLIQSGLARDAEAINVRPLTAVNYYLYALNSGRMEIWGDDSSRFRRQLFIARPGYLAPVGAAVIELGNAQGGRTDVLGDLQIAGGLGVDGAPPVYSTEQLIARYYGRVALRSQSTISLAGFDFEDSGAVLRAKLGLNSTASQFTIASPATGQDMIRIDLATGKIGFGPGTDPPGTVGIEAGTMYRFTGRLFSQSDATNPGGLTLASSDESTSAALQFSSAGAAPAAVNINTNGTTRHQIATSNGKIGVSIAAPAETDVEMRVLRRIAMRGDATYPGGHWMESSDNSIRAYFGLSAAGATPTDVYLFSTVVNGGINTFRLADGRMTQRAGGPAYNGGGTVYPTSPAPADGDLFYRTDLMEWHVYRSAYAAWVSTVPREVQFTHQALQPYSASATLFGMVETSSNAGTLIERLQYTYNVATTNDATNFWTIDTAYYNAAGTGVASNGSTTTTAAGIGAWATFTAPINTKYSAATAIQQVNVRATKTAAPGTLQLRAVVRYRLLYT